MRLFIAVDISSEVREKLRRLSEELEAGSGIKRSDVKWVKPENMHLTIKFLGEVKETVVADVCSIVECVAGGCKSFDMDIKGVGHFGGRDARVLWVGTGEGRESLCEMSKKLEEKMAAAGWPREQREFTGHLTLCRIRNPKGGRKLVEKSREYSETDFGTVRVDRVRVYQSQLTPEGPIYTVVAEYKLQ